MHPVELPKIVSTRSLGNLGPVDVWQSVIVGVSILCNSMVCCGINPKLQQTMLSLINTIASLFVFSSHHNSVETKGLRNEDT